MEAAPAAIPPNPKIAATIAMIRNITVQRSITKNFRFKQSCFLVLTYLHLSSSIFLYCHTYNLKKTMPLISLRSNSVTLPLLVEIFSLVERPLPVLPALPVKIYR
jgi:hypothetical protein